MLIGGFYFFEACLLNLLHVFTGELCACFTFVDGLIFVCGLHLRNGLRIYEKSFEVYVWL